MGKTSIESEFGSRRVLWVSGLEKNLLKSSTGNPCKAKTNFIIVVHGCRQGYLKESQDGSASVPWIIRPKGDIYRSQKTGLGECSGSIG